MNLDVLLISLSNNVIVLPIQNLVLLYFMNTVFRAKISIRLIIKATIIVSLILAIASTACSYYELNSVGYINNSYVVLSIILIIFQMLFLHKLYPSKTWNTLFFMYSIYGMLLTLSIWLFSQFLRRTYFIGSLSLPENWVFTLIMQLIACFSFVVFIYLCKKTKFFILLSDIQDFPRGALLLGVFYFIEDILVYYLQIHIYVAYGINPNNIELINILLYSSVLALYIWFFREYQLKSKVEQSKIIILQQQAYMERLESIQKELRFIQHDYKNIVSGLYLQIEESDKEDVKQYIQTKLLNIDKDVQIDIKQTNQLMNITNIELKGLVLVKIQEARKQSVIVHLEVSGIIDYIAIDTKDLLRCLGILIDNAIEESALTQDKTIYITMIQENSELSILVKNPLHSKVELSKINQLGYSTKDSNRGLGLASYQEIVHRYHNVYTETRIDDNQFIQIMRITQK